MSEKDEKKKPSLEDEDLFPQDKKAEEEEEPVQQPMQAPLVEIIEAVPGQKQMQVGNGRMVALEQRKEEGIKQEEGVYVSVGTDFYRGGDGREEHDPRSRTFRSGDRRYICMPDKNATIGDALNAAIDALPPADRTALKRLSEDTNVEIRSGGKRVHLEDKISDYAGIKITADGKVEYKQVDLLLTKEDQGGYCKLS